MQAFPLRIFLLLTPLTLLSVPARGGDEGVQVQPGKPRQGDALFITVTQRGVGGASAVWGGKTYPLYQDGDRWSGAVPIRPETKPGGYTLVVKVNRGGAKDEIRKRLEVARVNYPVQHLRMASGTSKLYNYPGVEVENRLVGGAVNTVSERRLWEGDWMLPSSPGRFSTYFGERRLRNGRAVGRHRGLDIASKKGTPVLAAADGKVVLAGSYRKHGKTVVLDHGQGVTSLYLHMNDFRVKKGQSVTRGTRLGSVGSTGVSTGPHLHWSVYVHGTPIEPLLFCRLSRRGVSY